MKEKTIRFFFRGEIEDAIKLLQSDYDGSYVNRISRKRARSLLQAWANHLRNFAVLSDTKASLYCQSEAERIGKLIIISEVEEG